MGSMLPSPPRPRPCPHPRAAPPSPPPPDDLLFEILLRLPPDPHHLHRASLVCKRWRRLIHSPLFLPSFRAFHRTPPVLGFYHNNSPSFGSHVGPSFVAAASVGPSVVFPDNDWRILGCRHGRVLLRSDPGWLQLLVWDPITGHRRSVRLGRLGSHVQSCNAAVLGDQDSIPRREGSFRVAFVFTGEGRASACIYSSETETWGRLIMAAEIRCGDVGRNPSALAGGNKLYWMLDDGDILELNLTKETLAVVAPPPDAMSLYCGNIQLMANGGGGEVGLVGMEVFSLQMWAREEASGSWVLRKTINLDVFAPRPRARLIHVPPVRLLGVDEDGRIVFVWTVDGIFMDCVCCQNGIITNYASVYMSLFALILNLVVKVKMIVH
uniref:F-box domain-containing protein n=1 Tax=Leersia perrieri TaxID=77586 RepID=A0A0D9XHS3_9ORYZ